jgi:hypothetical protein
MGLRGGRASVERTRLVVDTTDVETLVASEEGCAESATGKLFWLTSSQFQKYEPFPLTVTWGREARFSTAGVAAAEAARTLVTATRETDFMVVAGVFVCVVDGNSSRSVGARVGVGVVVSAREVLNESRRRGARCVEKGIRRRKEEVAVERTRARKTVWAVGGRRRGWVIFGAGASRRKQARRCKQECWAGVIGCEGARGQGPWPPISPSP